MRAGWPLARRTALVLLALLALTPGCRRSDAPGAPGTAGTSGTAGTGGANRFANGVIVETANGVTTYTNRLVDEKSPYLQLHAHNPVDWYPWGDAAFEKARREHKPIFLSIGYSTCHWCHVMEAESFSHPEIAALMNASFVSIKIDREERPDLDRVYMSYLTTVSGGGWPMSLFLTPDLKPFFGATYLPPTSRPGEEGFQQILTRIANDWREHPEAILAAAASGSDAISQQAKIPGPKQDGTDAKALDDTFDNLKRSYDGEVPGFGGAPRFPRPVVLGFMLRYHARTKNAEAREMTLATLRAMADGAIHDQLGGGFHRYTTDRAWRVPHFEKMLYDQAQLAMAYAEAYQLTKDAAFAAVAHDTLGYLLRDMREPTGAFASAEDADSKATADAKDLSEGIYYLWTDAEIGARLSSAAATLVRAHYGITPAGNIPAANDPEGTLTGKNTLAAARTVEQTATQLGMTPAQVTSALADARKVLLAARGQRPRPARDDKAIAAWNGLAMSAFARASQVFGRTDYRDAATAAAAFVETRLFDAKTGRLSRRFRAGAADVDGLLEDYAFLVQGLLDTYEASFDPRWLALAMRLQDTQDALFGDKEGGAYFSTRADAPQVLARMKEDYDGAEPAANSVSALNLLRLWQLTERGAWRDGADKTFEALSGRVARSGAAVPQLMSALDFRRSTSKQIVIAGSPASADTQALLRLVHSRYIPNKVVVVADGGAQQQALVKLVPFIADMTPRNGRATIYVCENYACRLPTNDVAVAAKLLSE